MALAGTVICVNLVSAATLWLIVVKVAATRQTV